ncbi:MAG: CCA tRNA nucleotidyltransferase [Melioribacteraceae bacterium]
MNLTERLEKYPFLIEFSKLAKKRDEKVYIVGGFVRDLFLSRDKKEFDFLIVGDGVEFANAISKKLKQKRIVIYKTFGTAQFHYDEYFLEFVGAREESYERGSRNPKIERGTFLQDIKRRDFTINTLAISLNENDFGEFIDTYNGLEDIEKRKLRTPIDPMITFDDDPLRIMRAFRFASNLEFDVVDEIKEAAREMKERLAIVAKERITDEFFKILSSKQPSIGLKLMFDSGVMSVVFPEISIMGGVEQRKDYHHKDVFQHTCIVVDNISKVTDDVWLRFAALVHDIAKPQTKRFVEGIGWTFHGHEEIGARMMKSVFDKLKLPLHKIEYIKKLIRLHLRPIALVDDDVTDSAIRRLIVQAGEELDDLITLCRADITSKNPNKVTKYLDNYEKVMNRVQEVREKDKLREFQSPVRGDEIMGILDIKPSKLVGIVKTRIEEAILEGEIPNEYNAALEYLMKIKNEYKN